MANIVNSAINALKSNIFGNQANITYGTGPTMPRKAAMGMDTSSPISRIENNEPLATNIWQYPRDIFDDLTGGHFMMFFINVQDKTRWDYNTPDGLGVGSMVAERKLISSEMAAGASAGDIKPVYEDVMVKGAKANAPSWSKNQNMKQGLTNNQSDLAELYSQPQQRMSGLSQVKPTTKRIVDSVSLYLPPMVTDNYSVQYSTTETGLLGFLAASGFKIGEAWSQNDYDRLARLGLGAFTGVVEELFKKVVASGLELLTDAEGGYEMWNKGKGRAANPYLEVFFQAPNLREFTYSFTFMPRSVDEQKEVQGIIKTFRFHMAPELRGEANRFMTLPSEFDIHYMYMDEQGSSKQNTFYNKIATCVLKDCKVNYTPDSKVASHSDGSSVKIQLDLSFQETEMITKDHIEAGF